MIFRSWLILWSLFLATIGMQCVRAEENLDHQSGKVWCETWVTKANEMNRQYVGLAYEHLPRPATRFGLADGATVPTGNTSAIHRLRGYLKPEQTGSYRFRVKGQGKAQLSLSPDEAVLGAKIVVSGGLAMTGKMIDAENLQIFPYSEPIYLEAGKSRFFEIVFYQERKQSNFAFEWIRPGGTPELVPASSMESFSYSADDEDQDDLPDKWEKENGLLISGAKPNHFATGDADFDGLNNGQEFLAGTSPTKADTDGDGVSDELEIHLLGSLPLDPNPPVGPAIHLDLFAGKALTYGWSRKDANTYESQEGLAEPFPDTGLPSLVNASGNGSIEWRISISKTGFQLISGEIQLIDSAEHKIRNTLEWWIDNQRLDDTPLVIPAMNIGRIALVSPFITKGKHTLRLRLRAISGAAEARIFNVQIQSVLEGDAQDRLVESLRKQNHFSRGTGESSTSPACVELVVRGTVPTSISAGKKQGIPLSPIGANGAWADVSLPENGDSISLQTKIENGGMLLESTVKWVETNLFKEGDLIVRQGDALRLTLNTGQAGTSNLMIDGNEKAMPAGKATIHRFDKLGEVILRAKFVPSDGSVALEVNRTVTVLPRTKTVDIGWANVGESSAKFDSPNQKPIIDGIGVATISQKDTSAKIEIFPTKAGNFNLPLRISPQGPVCGNLQLHAAELIYTSKYLTNVYSETDHTPIRWEVSVMTNNAPKGSKLRLEIQNSKVWLPAGSKEGNEAIQTLDAANEEGIVLFHAIARPGGKGGFGHDVHLIMPDGKSF